MKKVSVVQTKDFIANAIRKEILSGRLEAGEELTQETLAQMLGVSRMPVREALQLLEQEGFIERLPNRHMVVASLERGRLEEILRLTAAMESEIASLCIGRQMIAGTEALEAMRQALAEMRTEDAMKWELEYHVQLASTLENTYISQLFENVLGGYISYMIGQTTRDLNASMELLSVIHKGILQGNRNQVQVSISAYYEGLLVSWNRKGQI